MEAQSLSTCNQCGKSFQRKAHLLRHQQQHSGDRPYSCRFCAKTFKRSDVLRDHFSRCEQRGTSAIPSSLERGRKRHACDECSRLKVKCDNNVPCRKCKEFGRTCVKSRAKAVSSPESTPGVTTPDMNGSNRNSIGFLLNGPSDADFIREFPKDGTLSPPQGKTPDFPVGTLGRGDYNRYESIAGEVPPVPPVSAYNDYGPPGVAMGSDLEVFLGALEFENFERQTQILSRHRENLTVLPTLDGFQDRGMLEQRAFDIRDKLRYTASTLNHPNPPPKDQLDAIENITAINIDSWIKLYFKHWHKHGPMVHEATFNPCTAALPLVLVLMALGGMYSLHEDTTMLKTLLDTIETFIYSVPGINDEYDLPGRIYIRHSQGSSVEWQRYQLEELQGAYLMCVLQYWTGNAISRKRVRQQRFSRVIAIMRHLDMQTAQHPSNFVIKDQQSFSRWILNESYVRTATIATMLDNAFGVFNNISPRFQWAEIDLPFPSDDRTFRLANYDQLLATQQFPTRKMKIKDAFLSLFTPPDTSDYNLSVLRDGHLTALDMQMLIHFLYTQIWTTLFTNPFLVLPQTHLQSVVQPFKTAMKNWKTIWDETRSLVPEIEWNKLGFQRTAETYYDTVLMIVDVWERKGGRFPPLKSDCEKGDHLKKLLSF